MNAIKVLKNDHHVVDQLLKKYSTTATVGRKEEVATRIIEELNVHSEVEDEYVYRPAMERSPALEKFVLEAKEEHQLIKAELLHLEGLVVSRRDGERREEKLDAVLKVLTELFHLHQQQEEAVFFPELQRVMSSAELEAIGLVLVQAKATAPKFPRLPRTVSTIARLVDKAVEAGKDLLDSASGALKGI